MDAHPECVSMVGTGSQRCPKRPKQQQSVNTVRKIVLFHLWDTAFTFLDITHPSASARALGKHPAWPGCGWDAEWPGHG